MIDNFPGRLSEHWPLGGAPSFGRAGTWWHSGGAPVQVTDKLDYFIGHSRGERIDPGQRQKTPEPGLGTNVGVVGMKQKRTKLDSLLSLQAQWGMRGCVWWCWKPVSEPSSTDGFSVPGPLLRHLYSKVAEVGDDRSICELSTPTMGFSPKKLFIYF